MTTAVSQAISPTTVRLIGVRLSFPSLFAPTDFDGDGKFAYRASFLFPKKNEKGEPSLEATLMTAAVKEALKKKYGEKWEAKLQAYKASGKIWAIQDGDIKAAANEMYDAYSGCYFVSSKSKIQPPVVDNILGPDKKPKPLSEKDGRPYSGCYVNAVVEVYAYDAGGGGVTSELKGVMFSKDGDSFGGSKPLSPDAFEDLAVPQEAAAADSGDSLF